VAIAKNSQAPSSAYLHMMQKIVAASSRMAENGSSADLVAKVVLSAFTNTNPNLRYLAGKDVKEWVRSENSMSDIEFHNMMRGLSK